jgi:hypothetical protein
MLVFVEKPSLVPYIHDHIARLFSGEVIDYVLVHPYGNPFVYDYPSKLSWEDYPACLEARYRIDETRVRRARFVDSGRAISEPCDYADFADGQQAIAVMEADRVSVFASERLRRHLTNMGKVKDWCGTFGLAYLTEEGIAQALSTPLEQERVATLCAEAQLKADFEFSFLVNASGILTRTFHWAGGAAASPVFSKYTIQTLYAIWRGGRKTDGRTVQMMQRWTGTGRYVGVRGRLGSESSSADILDTLLELGLIDKQGVALGVSELGERFLRNLHPDCEDVDLPFRLETWLQTPAQSRPAAERYIRTWFGKQMRFSPR